MAGFQSLETLILSLNRTLLGFRQACSGDEVVTGQEHAGKHSWRAGLTHFNVHMNHPSFLLKPIFQFFQQGWDGARESVLLIKSQVVLKLIF